MSDTEWLILFESVDFTETDYTFINHIRAFGTKWKKNGFYNLIEVVTEVEGIPMFSEEDCSEFILNPFNFEILVQGEPRRFEVTEVDYQNAGADLNDEYVPMAAKLLRLLIYLIPDKFFFSDEKLLERCDCDPTSLELFLEPKDWYHPDIIELEQPSENPCFQSLAKAIATRDASLYQCPEKYHNTHWSNWEWYKEEDDENDEDFE